MRIQVLDKAKKKRFLEELKEFGVEKISGMLVRSGKERVLMFSGDLSREEVMEIWRLVPIEGVGLYVGKDFVNRSGIREVRLSVDGAHVLATGESDRVVELDSEQEEKWFAGDDVNLGEAQIEGVGGLGSGGMGNKIRDGFVLVKSGEDFVGVGKLSNGVLYNFLPKERRRRERL